MKSASEHLGCEDDAEFVVVNLPAVAEIDEYIDGELFRKEGDPICPRLKPMEYYVWLRRQMGEFGWRATMQGDPTVPEGGKIWGDLEDKWLFTDNEGELITEFPAAIRYMAMAVDPATGKKPTSKGADYTVVLAMGLGYDGLLYVDCVMEKTGFDGTLKNIAMLKSTFKRKVDLIGIESNGFQGELRVQAQRVLPQAGIKCPILPIQNSGSKHARILQLDPLLRGNPLDETSEGGSLIRFVRSQGTMTLIDQIKDYPPGTSGHDDGPDALHMGTRVISKIFKQSGAQWNLDSYMNAAEFGNT